MLLLCSCFHISRNILDVNIDALKEKPWRYPGVDITDYFNFGLDEESWKQYCSSLVIIWPAVQCIVLMSDLLKAVLLTLLFKYDSFR